MALALVHTRALDGMSAPEVVVETHLANGLPAFSLVGLPDTEVREARDRVRAALQTAGFDCLDRDRTGRSFLGFGLAAARGGEEAGREGEEGAQRHE